jgi:transcriptional regulator with XRE-family HTH domain
VHHPLIARDLYGDARLAKLLSVEVAARLKISAAYIAYLEAGKRSPVSP